MEKTKEWHDRRRQGITGTGIGAICGLNRYQTPLDVYLEKIGEIDHTTQHYSDAMRFGNLLEPVVADEYARRVGVEVLEECEILEHKDHKFMLGSIDRWVGQDKGFILECKTARFISKEWGQQYTDEIPASYLCQVAWCVAICDVPKADIAVLFGGQEFRIYTYERNIEFEDKLIKIADNFWNNNVLKRIPPE